MKKVKQCTKCKKIKDVSEFYIRKNGKTRSHCKECELKENKIWKEKNKEHNKKYYKDHINEKREYNKKYYQNHKEEILKEKKKYGKQYRIKHKDELKERKRKDYKKHKEKRIKSSRRYYWERRKISGRKCRRDYQRERKKTNINYRIKCNVSTTIYKQLRRQLLNKGGKSTLKILGDDYPQKCIEHLESLFEPWMNWNNWTNKAGCWTIDHIIPQSSFNFANHDGTLNEDEIRKCWALENLQPMEFIENIKKSNEY